VYQDKYRADLELYLRNKKRRGRVDNGSSSNKNDNDDDVVDTDIDTSTFTPYQIREHILRLKRVGVIQDAVCVHPPTKRRRLNVLDHDFQDVVAATTTRTNDDFAATAPPTTADSSTTTTDDEQEHTTSYLDEDVVVVSSTASDDASDDNTVDDASSFFRALEIDWSEGRFEEPLLGGEESRGDDCSMESYQVNNANNDDCALSTM
jgi:hypothetical protein